MNYYTHMQHVQHKQQEASQRYREREQRTIALEAKRSIKMPFSLWRVIWAWFVVRRKAQNADEALALFIRYLQPRKAKSESA